jgi:hypothetical protein
VLGRPAGGASVEFKRDVMQNAVNPALPVPYLLSENDWVDFRTFTSWDIGLAHDSTIGLDWMIPKAGVTVESKCRIVNYVEIRGGESQTLDHIAYAIRREQMIYRSETAVDASGLGGIAAVRQLRDMKPQPLSFVAKSNHRIFGNMRLAAITNGIEMLTWGRTDDPDRPWGLVEIPHIQELLDQLANFDRDAKNVPDDWVWSFLIGLWYIRRYWVVGRPPTPQRFDPRSEPRKLRKAIPLRRR